MSQQHPDSTRSDELSLRDLYLIMRRGLPVIIGVALVAGALAFGVSSLLPPSYEAEGTTLITPPQINPGNAQSLNLSPSVNISLESYQTLALSRPVLEAVLADVPRAALSPDALRRAGSITRLLGPERSDQIAPLAMTHTVRHENPQVAAALTNAWTERSLTAVRDALLANLTPVSDATTAELEALETRLREAERALADFERQDTTPALEARLEQLSERIAEAEGGAVVLSEFPLLANNELFGAPPANLAQEITAGEALVQSLRSQAGDNPGEAFASQLALRQAVLESLRSRQTLLTEQLAGYRQDFTGVQEQLAESRYERAQLERRVDSLQLAYQELAAVQPTIAYTAQLAPAGARILNAASVPDEPVGPRRLLNTALATVLGGMLALLFVFVREAVVGVPHEVHLSAARRRSSTVDPASGD